MKQRIFKDKNYKAFYFNGKTLRMAIDPSKPILELDYPEFYDVKITNFCRGECPYCYMDSKSNVEHTKNVVGKIKSFFGRSLRENQKPFQVAIGGGEPTESPDFLDVLKTFHDLGITPNYTTNGMFVNDQVKCDKIIKATKKYSEGVAISCHDHLKKYWTVAAQKFYEAEIKLNLHLIISDEKSIDYFLKIFKEWESKVSHFVLLPYGSQGRAKNKKINWEYLVNKMPKDTTKIAFGANFHPYLSENPNLYKVSLYEPESMSKFLDLETMKVFPSSFAITKGKNNEM